MTPPFLASLTAGCRTLGVVHVYELGVYLLIRGVVLRAFVAAAGGNGERNGRQANDRGLSFG
jgi:hypothetical protein